MTFHRETFPSIAAACAGLEQWTAGVPGIDALLALVNYTDPEHVHVTLASRDYWRERCRADRDLDGSSLAKALELEDAATELRVVLYDGRISGSMLLSELRESINILQEREGQHGR